MCLAIPMQVKSLEGKNAVVEVEGVERDADVSFLEPLMVGDYVIVHAGFAIQKLDEVEALKTLELFKELELA
ncbi:hypothetical protein AUK40_05045 [Candidatus Wirthbacteria bacterium CG2_30_54_11]|uniref:Hydrogenase assembly protein HypC n=1 Tax=Candidatus Wirthbacteria bacterium CG2_30_54_11 TaxID=1817892 RepID=A0A1J5IH71_9BACT|nr:MAG: hypothetical protein AUK40_05045 [Candidatus Wirthbacteria bacterium CG2_30_54_11]